jgi:hypothetical protein
MQFTTKPIMRFSRGNNLLFSVYLCAVSVALRVTVFIVVLAKEREFNNCPQINPRSSRLTMQFQQLFNRQP